jgi:membrane-bound ClpP family serine protease
MLAVVWTVSRSGEGLVQIYNKKNYWRLLDLAKQYAGASDAERKMLEDLRLDILKSKRSNFMFAQILFSIGTLTYSIVFVTYGVVPAIIGWFGIVAAVLYGFGNGIILAKSNLKVLWNIGGLLILLFELALGGWLLFFLHQNGG